ncbi:MAG: FKBP-type peptidyl-prolyl cis-trans isomerase [Chitinophagales bacterium]|jgi:FKBP-type peptidyl-prolyl cis-trans isomerase|tara:strand:+ start:4945 stop:5655 length:711 start_codon:yes stop_codon:yes gene_type:complete
MSKLNKVAVVGFSALVLFGCNEKAAEALVVALDNDEQKLSYSMGRTIAEQLVNGGFDVDIVALKAGIDDAHSGAASKVSEADFNASRDNMIKKLEATHEAEQADLSSANAETGAKYLAENATAEGVVTTTSGLQYKVITTGEGDMPGTSDSVTVHYRGTLVDGTEFDSSYSRNEPATFPVNAVIPGWTEALQLMPVGSKWELTIPSKLAYGPAATGAIGPDSVLLFEVELLSIAQQ